MFLIQQVTKDETRWQMMNKGAQRVIDDTQWQMKTRIQRREEQAWSFVLEGVLNRTKSEAWSGQVARLGVLLFIGCFARYAPSTHRPYHLLQVSSENADDYVT